MPLRRPDLVVFDLGGVLVRIARSWREACETAGVRVHDAADEMPALAARRPWVLDYERGRIDRPAFLEGTRKAVAGAYTIEELRRIHDGWLIGEYPGVGEVLGGLETAGVPSAVLSNTNAAHWAEMVPPPPGPTRYPALRRVRHLVASHLIGARKPEPAAFARVEDVSGARGPGVVFFDDLPENLEAARDRGWRGVLVDPSGDPARQIRAALAGLGVGLPAAGA
jgi:putative hydrolase of the HAD superfamily